MTEGTTESIGNAGVTDAKTGGALFARQSTGLVREISTSKTIFLNLGYMSLPLGMLYLSQLSGIFPGVNVTWAFIATALLCVIHLMTYGSLAEAMPRSGGDYIFLSRTIHPLVGFVANATYTVFQVFSAAFVVLFIPTFALPSMFEALALTTGSSGWADAAVDVTSKGWQFGIAAVLIVALGLVTMAGVRFSVRVFTVFMGLTALGLVVTVVALLTISGDDFSQRFAEVGSVQGVIDAARDGGFSFSDSNLYATVAAAALLWGAFGVAHVATYFAGEIRRASRMMNVALLGSLAIFATAMVTLALLSSRSFGFEFMAAAQYVGGTGDWPVQAAPFLNLFIGIGSGSTLLVVIVGATYVAGVLALIVPTYMLATRNIFAQAFEGVLPMRLAEVNERTHTPIRACLAVMVVMLAFVFGFVYVSADLIAYIAVSQVVSFVLFGLVGVAAVLFPYRRRELFEASPLATAKVFGLPRIAVLGVAQVILMGFLLSVLLFSRFTEALGTTRTGALLFLAGVVTVTLTAWLIAWGRSRASGYDISATQQVLPPE